MSEVIRHNKLDISSLHYSKPINQNNLYYGSIDYNNNPCYIQTAKLVVEDIKEVNKQKDIVLKVDPDDFSFYDLLVKLDDHNLNDWNDMLSVNLTGPYICCKAVIPEMKKVGKGKIINFGSIASFMGRPDRVGYVAAKSGVLGLTRALAIDLKGTNINVNTICPGLISTSFNKKYAEDPTHGEKWGKETIVGRWGLPSDIVGAAIFLSSDDSDFINGSEIKIDGGWLAAKTREGEVD